MKYVAVSGGADSVALALLLWERGGDLNLFLLTQEPNYQRYTGCCPGWPRP